MSLDKYYADIARELKQQSDRIRIGFSTHAPSAGENREDIVANFLSLNLPKAFGVDTGIILSSEGEFSNQADVVIVDQLNNAPLYPSSSNKVWLVESVFAMVEVKTHLNPGDISDSIEKCRRFKRLKREFESVPEHPRINESLFVIWGFNGPSPETIKTNLSNVLITIPVDEQPDFVIIPDSIVVSAGCYRRLVLFGNSGSRINQTVLAQHPGKSYEEIFNPVEYMVSNENSVLIFLTWLSSWLKGAGKRSAPLTAYLDQGKIWGEYI